MPGSLGLGRIVGFRIGEKDIATPGRYTMRVQLESWLLATRDAHPVYEKPGFKPLEYPKRWMMIREDKAR